MSPEQADADVRVFLIADIRGYTRFTQERGDAAAAQLTSKFASIVAEVVEGHDGRLMELRGDEALASFGSPRRALLSAVALQKRFFEETEKEPELPLGVGIGLDVGEAVPVEEGYRGGALNVAARLCARASAGEVFATREVTHLARTIPDVRYEPQRSAALKGLDTPVHLVKVRSADGDLAASFRTLLASARAQGASRASRGPWVWVAAALVAVGGIAGGLALMARSGDSRLDIRSGVGQLEAESSELLAAIDAPSGALEIAPGGVWVADPGGHSIAELDPDVERVVETVDVGPDPASLTYAFSALWVANAGGASVSRVNTEAKDVVDTIAVGNAPSSIVGGEGGVWVANRFDDTVSRINPSNGRVAATIDVDDGPVAIEVADGFVWVVSESAATVSKIDPSSNQVADVVRVGNGPSGIAAARSSIWVSNAPDGTVSRVATDTGTVTATLSVGKTPSAIAADGRFVWVANEEDATVTKIDADRASRLDTLSVSGTPTALAARAGSVWVSVAPSLGHRGGTLRLVGSASFASGSTALDPAFAYDPTGWKVLSMTNDGLVDFKRVGGADGTTVVPNLAVALPDTSEDGRSYTFELRDGVRYSTGERVTPADVRWSMERVMQAGQIDYYDAIVGAAVCRPNKDCDLSDGIVVDDETNSVTFRLTRADPEFLYKLALPFGSVVPEGTPVNLKPGETVPATGPYRINESEERAGLHLVRNDSFDPWAPAAQPDGYADEILIEALPDEQRVEAVRRGKADALLDGLPPQAFGEIRTRFADQLYIQPSANTFYMVLNTTQAPFDRVAARRAINLAVDRERVAQLFGGAEQAVPTCQILPPNYPGYRRSCRYTADPNQSGMWTAQDLSRAQRLVARSGTSGMRVEVWNTPEVAPPGFGEYFEGLLDSLGYKARLRSFRDPGAYFTRMFAAPKNFQIALNGWFQDYPAPSNFFLGQYRCSDFRPGEPTNLNASGFCEPSIDRMIASALEAQGVDPSGSAQQWAAVDMAIMEEAPIVPLVNINFADFVSDRVGNVTIHPVWGLLPDQLWVS